MRISVVNLKFTSITNIGENGSKKAKILLSYQNIEYESNVDIKSDSIIVSDLNVWDFREERNLVIKVLDGIFKNIIQKMIMLLVKQQLHQKILKMVLFKHIIKILVVHVKLIFQLNYYLNSVLNINSLNQYYHILHQIQLINFNITYLDSYQIH